MPATEILLHGGTTNAGRVTRVGETVRRPLRPTSPATHALLDHLEHLGFDGAPRFLGTDEHGREVLTYIAGEAAIVPYPDWALTDEALVSVAELLRRYHDAVVSFDVSSHTWAWAVPAAFRGALASHNDPNLDNVIFRHGRAVALIDFDLAGPGSVAWDVACAARLWAPLRDERDVPEALRGRALERLRLFVEAYGASERERARIVDATIHTHDWAYEIVRDALARGHRSFHHHWREGGRLRADRTREWIGSHREPMRDVLIGGGNR
jgi:hypothetical protein